MVWVKRLGIALVLLVLLTLVAVAVTGVVFVRAGFPQTEGERTLAGLDGDVEVLRDGHGVPTIVASSSDDLFRAQGYVHAQDRYWEMDMRRHVTAGRVAELFGADQVETDTFVRTLGWRAVAERELELLEPETIAMLEAYAEGVNAWTEGRSGRQLSLEHALLPLTGAGGYEPEPWGPVDSVAWLKAMAWDLRSNLEVELLRGRLAAADLPGDRDWRELFPDFDGERFPTILAEGGEVTEDGFVPEGTDVQRPVELTSTTDVLAGPPDTGVDAALAEAQRALAASPDLLGDGAAGGLGSNSWVVAPDRSTTGTALLANDPHLGPSQPSLWYQQGLRCEPVGPGCPYHNLGFSFAGLPGIVIGQNADLGWGFTNLGADVADLFVERLDDDHYLTEDGWEPLEQRQETIVVAGGDDVEITVRETRHGPLLSDVSEGASEIADDAPDGEHAVALKWVALEPRPTVDALPHLMRADDWTSFRAAAERFETPSQNMVYADTEGTIGYQAPGRIPVRRAGDGTQPVPGWTGEYGWERFLDFEELPWLLDPDVGYIATANQPALPEGDEPFLTRDANPGYRAERIHELLQERSELSPSDLRDIQIDNHNGNAANLVPALLTVDADHTAVAEMQEVLAAWDLQDDPEAAGAAAFNATWRHLLARTFHAELPEFAHPDGGGRWWEVVRRLLDDPRSVWWDDPTTEERETRDDVLRSALIDAHAELTERLGDPDGWEWGELHTLTLEHGTFGTSGIAPIERLFNRGPLETGGGSDVINATGWNAAAGYEVTWVPSMRMVLDLGDLDAGEWIHLTGQSGRPFHGHYTDQAELWRDGGTIGMAFGAGAVEEAAHDRLRLAPKN